jgi:hypothetical protein
MEDVMSTLQGILTLTLKKHAEELRQRMLAAQTGCEDGMEPLATAEQDYKLMRSLVRMAEAQDSAFRIALDCVKAVTELDTSLRSAMGSGYKTPRESAEFTIYALRQLGFVDAKEIKRLMDVPSNPATLIATNRLEA